MINFLKLFPDRILFLYAGKNSFEHVSLCEIIGLLIEPFHVHKLVQDRLMILWVVW